MDTEQDAELDSDLFSNPNILNYTKKKNKPLINELFTF